MLKIKETIVVEGRGDASNIARVCDANFIITSGLHISKKTFDEIDLALNSSGIIIFTDPDSAGKTIRRKIVEKFKGREDRIKHANITIREAKKKGDVGVENADDEAIIAALSTLRVSAVPVISSTPPVISSTPPVISSTPPVISNVSPVISSEVERTQNPSFMPQYKPSPKYTMQDMITLGLAGKEDSAKKRQILCDFLRIPYSNAKTLAKKLTYYRIEISEIEKVTSL